jgi:hypothetical protein
MILTRHEKEKLIVELYNQNKTYKEIAKIARVSVRDIKPILEKAERAREKELAYRLFSEDKTPLDVQIELNLEEPEVTGYYREYWKLRDLYSLNMVYEEIGDANIIHLLKAYTKIRESGMGFDQAVTLIKNANNDLQTLEERMRPEVLQYIHQDEDLSDHSDHSDLGPEFCEKNLNKMKMLKKKIKLKFLCRDLEQVRKVRMVRKPR